MSTLSEIEEAVDRLGPGDQAALLRFVSRRVLGSDYQPRTELLAKWRAQGSGLIEETGGVQAYLDLVRGRDDDGR